MKLGLGIFGYLLCAQLCGAAESQTVTPFATYSQCKLTDDLALVETTPLAKGIEGRTVKTVMGPKRVPLTGGVRLMYAYPGTEPIANVKVERIPAGDYAQAKQDLIANFDQILNADDSSARNYGLKPRLNGLEIYGLDRKKLEGGVLGIYLFFADRTHTATTVYFLNQDPSLRRFDSLEGYATLRDAFLETYTGCVGGHARPAGEQETTAKIPAATTQAPLAPPAAAAVAAPVAALPEAPLPQGAAAAQASVAAPAAPGPVAASKPATVRKPAAAKQPTAAKQKVLPRKPAARTAPVAAKEPKKAIAKKSPPKAKKKND